VSYVIVGQIGQTAPAQTTTEKVATVGFVTVLSWAIGFAMGFVGAAALYGNEVDKAYEQGLKDGR
jgi:hypothetical protein